MGSPLCVFHPAVPKSSSIASVEAMASYKTLLEKVSFAQCWDPNGWFWKPADAAKKQVKMLEFEVLDAE